MNRARSSQQEISETQLHNDVSPDRNSLSKTKMSGVLLVNLGTPEAPTTSAVRTYLREFLSDQRLVADKPRILWWFLLNLVILPNRPARSANLYRKIWTAEGSPLLVITRAQAAAVEIRLEECLGRTIPVQVGMRYGSPSIEAGLDALAGLGCTRIHVLPLFPQYSAATVGTTFDAVAATLTRRRRVPDLQLITSYHVHPDYIAALAASVRDAWQETNESDHLLVSFHGLPQRFIDNGDPYQTQCEATAAALAAALDLDPAGWSLAYQSRFGREPWIGPSTGDELRRLGKIGARKLHVICPGFAADCLETLEEVNIGCRELFEQAGGEALHYIPALNDRDDHIAALADFVARYL